MRVGVLIVVLVWGVSVARGGVTELIAFGDSLSDVGNISAGTFGFQPGGAYFQGRFSNGPVWVEGLAGRLGVTNPRRSSAGGRNYAYGGTTTGDGFLTVNVLFFTLNFPNAGEQVNRFLGTSPVVDGDELVTLWAGGNDLFNVAGSLSAVGDATVAGMVSNVSTAIDRLTGAGVRHVVLPNLPPLGQTPDNAGNALLDVYAERYNAQLATLVNQVNASGAASVYLVDVAGLFEAMLTDPGRYGFVNTTDAYLSGGVGDANGYVFFDGVHPTARAHDYLAQAAWQAFLGGDLDGSGALDAGDLSLILGDLGMTDPAAVGNVAIDLTVDEADVVLWVEERLGSVVGDFNLDRSVDLIDLSVLAGGFGGAGDYLGGDANLDGVVDLVDLSALASVFGFGSAAPSPGVGWAVGFVVWARAGRRARV